jgi:hypothetical protein
MWKESEAFRAFNFDFLFSGHQLGRLSGAKGLNEVAVDTLVVSSWLMVLEYDVTMQHRQISSVKPQDLYLDIRITKIAD